MHVYIYIESHICHIDVSIDFYATYTFLLPRRQQLVRAIGVSNFTASHLQQLIEACNFPLVG